MSFSVENRQFCAPCAIEFGDKMLLASSFAFGCAGLISLSMGNVRRGALELSVSVLQVSIVTFKLLVNCSVTDSAKLTARVVVQ